MEVKFYPRTAEQLSIFYNRNQEVHFANKEQTKDIQSMDSVQLSAGIHNIGELGFKIVYHNQSEENNIQDFQYTLSDGLVQMQSMGSYDKTSNKGHMEILFDFSKLFQAGQNNTDTIPKLIKFNVNFVIDDPQNSNSSNIVYRPPDMLAIITQIVKNIDELISKLSDKDQKQADQHLKNIIGSSKIETEKLFKDLLEYLDTMAKKYSVKGKSDDSGNSTKDATLLLNNGSKLKLSDVKITIPE